MNRRNFVKMIPFSSAALLESPRSAHAKSEDKESRPLCLEYLERVRNMLVTIKNNESDNLLEADPVNLLP